MDALEAIYSRHSIRKYSTHPVTEEAVQEILKAAMAAPSAGNEQPWHFVVVTDRGLLDGISGFHEYASMLKQAPLAILVCGDLSLEKHKGYWVQDCAAATQNLLLAAHAKGLGAVWLGIHPVEKRILGAQKLFGLPKSVIPLAVVAIGYPAEKREPVSRFDPARIHHNKW
jgi:nitroreductase